MPPKRPNPFQQTDLSAMRELANESVRDAIRQHAQNRRGWLMATQLASAIIPFLSGLILVVLGQSLHRGLTALGALLMMGSMGISVCQYQKWSGGRNRRPNGVTADELPAEEARETSVGELFDEPAGPEYSAYACEGQQADAHYAEDRSE